jgi:hypothetical protein
MHQWLCDKGEVPAQDRRSILRLNQGDLRRDSRDAFETITLAGLFLLAARDADAGLPGADVNWIARGT